MQQEMLLRDEETMELRGTYTSLQQEVEVKTKKLKKVRCHSRTGSRCARARQPLPNTVTCPRGVSFTTSSPLCLNCLTPVTLPGVLRSGEGKGWCWGGIEPSLLGQARSDRLGTPSLLVSRVTVLIVLGDFPLYSVASESQFV